MSYFDGVKETIAKNPGAQGALLGLACTLTAVNGMRLNTLDGIYPIEWSLIARHALAMLASFALYLVYRRRGGDPLFSSSKAPVFVVAGGLTLSLLFRYSGFLLIATNPTVTLVGKLAEEFFGALLLLAWAERILMYGGRATITILAGAYFMYGAAQVALTFFQRIPCMFALMMLPIVSVAIFRAHLRTVQLDSSLPDPGEKKIALDCITSRSNAILYFAVMMLFFFFAGQILHPTLSLQRQEVLPQLSIALGHMLAGLLFLALLETTRKNFFPPYFFFTLFYLVLFAIMTIAFALMNNLDSASVTIYLALASIAADLTSSLAWTSVLSIRLDNSKPTTTIAFGFTCLYGTRTVSVSAMLASSEVPAFPYTALIGILLGAALILTVVLISRLLASGKSATSQIPAEAPEAPARVETPFRDALAELAHAYSLTAQEENVLGFCAKGMNAQRISEEMVISPNTVKSYMRSLYAKLGVHSQQDIIKLVDAGLKELKSHEA